VIADITTFTAGLNMTLVCRGRQARVRVQLWCSSLQLGEPLCTWPFAQQPATPLTTGGAAGVP
jgi:hypothetical protein